jgi:putative membrane protein
MSADTPSRLGLRPLPWILGLSAAITAFLFWLIYFRDTSAEGAPVWVAHLPAANAALNGLAACCLVLGYRAIRSGHRAVHMRWMVTAVTFSALFLVSYVTYHQFHGDTPFPGTGWVRPLYFFILISHIALSIVALPMILSTLLWAMTSKFDKHRAIARWTFPVWLYVSVTGVVVFLFLKAYT